MKRAIFILLSIFMIMSYTYAENASMTDTEIEEVSLNYFSEKTGLPVSVLRGITHTKIYDFLSDWYIALGYSEPIETNNLDNNSEALILLSIYLNKEDNTISDAQNNTAEILFPRISQYRNKRLTYIDYFQINQSWEKLFGPVIYWQYDTVAAFELLYHVRPNTNYMKEDMSRINDGIKTLDKPEAVFPNENTISFQEALNIAKQCLSQEYDLDQNTINNLKYGSIIKENDIPNLVFASSNKTADVYWVITFYSNDIRCYACQILEDGSVEQTVQFSENGKGILYDDRVYE